MIVIKDLSYGYRKGQQLFEGLNLTLHPGKVYGLLGRNGAGKSSLIKQMAGLLFPMHGSCTINGREARHRDPVMLEQLFFIPEECQLPPVTIPVFLRIYQGFYPNFNLHQFEEYLRIFRVPPDSHLRRLSFGQKKKVYIAFALAANTAVLIMDEPTNGLDIPSKLQFRDIVRSASCCDRLTIMSTHQIKDMDNLIDNVIMIDQGQILLHADKAALTEYFSPEPLDLEILFNRVIDQRS
ncbi:MAG TPA: ABC transporter ATP-binding protein [Mucilaginibacter sp.]|nr:ABC transporter ATP-binding protein [Mucilaginibacter sp.]